MIITDNGYDRPLRLRQHKPVSQTKKTEGDRRVSEPSSKYVFHNLSKLARETSPLEVETTTSQKGIISIHNADERTGEGGGKKKHSLPRAIIQELITPQITLQPPNI